MGFFIRYTPETASEKSAPLLQELQNKYGMNVNIFADMAESPLPIKLYTFGQDLLNAEGTLSNEEVNLVQLAVSVANECRFCVAAHSTVARHQFKTDDAVVDAIRNGQTVPDEKFEALVSFANSVVFKRGQLYDTEFQAFIDAGYTREQIFEVLSIAAYKTITNYTSQFAGTEPNEAFAAEAWEPKSTAEQAA